MAAPAGPLLRRLARPAAALRGIGAVLLLALLAHALHRWPMPALDRLEDAWQDRQLLAQAPREHDPRLVLVEIDERALERHGRWPWPRARLARLVEQLGGPQQAALIGLDIVLAEPEHAPLAPLWQALTAGPQGLDAAALARLQPLREAFEGDARLAAALHRWPVVAGVHLSGGTGATRIGVLPPGPPLTVDAAAAGQATASAATLLPTVLPDWPGHGGLTAPLAAASWRGVGVLNGEVDEDGVLRHMALLWRSGQTVHPTLALAMLQAATTAPAWHLHFDATGQASRLGLSGTVRPPMATPMGKAPTLATDASASPAAAAPVTPQIASDLTWTVDPRTQVRIPYRVGEQPFRRVSASDVLDGRLPPGSLNGRWVLVGVTAPGLLDQRLTVTEPAMPGTLIHAHLLSGLLDGRTLATPAWAPLAQAALLLAGGLLLLWRLPRSGIVASCALALLVCGGVVIAHAWAWQRLHAVLPVVDALLLPALLLLLWLTLSLRAVQSARGRLQALFGQYVPPEHVQRMSRDPHRHTMGSRQVELSVLFADVRGFTGLAERMPPAELSAMMNLLFSRLTDIIRAHGGTLDKYIGDAVMAFWGAPLDDPRHALHAVDAALAMRAALPALQDELAAHGWPRLDLAIGIDSGPVVVGDMGSRHRLAYTALGDTVNRAARLQGLAGEHDIGCLIGDATRLGLARDRLCLPLGEVRLRGRDTRLPVWYPLPVAPGQEPATDSRLRRWDDWWYARGLGDTARAAAARAVLQTWPEDRALVAWVEAQARPTRDTDGGDRPARAPT